MEYFTKHNVQISSKGNTTPYRYYLPLFPHLHSRLRSHIRCRLHNLNNNNNNNSDDNTNNNIIYQNIFGVWSTII